MVKAFTDSMTKSKRLAAIRKAMASPLVKGLKGRGRLGRRPIVLGAATPPESAQRDNNSQHQADR
jgi:hypothetical protein